MGYCIKTNANVYITIIRVFLSNSNKKINVTSRHDINVVLFQIKGLGTKLRHRWIYGNIFFNNLP